MHGEHLRGVSSRPSNWQTRLSLGDADDSPCPDGHLLHASICQVAKMAGVEPSVDDAVVPPSSHEAMASLDTEGL